MINAITSGARIFNQLSIIVALFTSTTWVPDVNLGLSAIIRINVLPCIEYVFRVWNLIKYLSLA